jgi:glycosyltransferase involved in cell wall biosynthesis
VVDLFVAIPGDLATPTGGYAYARRVLALLPEKGILPKVVALPGSFPTPSSVDLDETTRLFAALPPGVPLLVDGLAYGALPPETIEAAGGRPIIALVHHPLGLEEGLGEAASRALIESERAALTLATRVIVTSPYTGRLLTTRFGVPCERLHVALPGTDVAPISARPPPPPSPRGGGDEGGTVSRQDRGASPPPVGEGGPAQQGGGGGPHDAVDIAILAIGAVTRRKGYDVLVRALAMLADLPWRATIVGALDRAPDHVETLRRLIRDLGLDGRVALAGSVSAEALEVHYRRASLVVSSSLFEGYGMVLAESLARGLPVVMARGGAADETVPDAAALKVPPGDAAALAEALRAAVSDDRLRARLAAAASEAGRRLPRWEDAARVVAEAVLAACGEVAA